MERAYVKTLSPDDATLYDQEQQAGGSTPNPPGIPDALVNSFAFPYAFGPTFVDTLVAKGGTAEIDFALKNPPVAEAQVISPDMYITGIPIQTVASPKLASREARIDPPSTFGQVSMLDVLGERLGFTQAWNADSRRVPVRSP